MQPLKNPCSVLLGLVIVLKVLFIEPILFIVYTVGTVPVSNARRTPQQAQNICKTFLQCWTNVEDVGPRCTNVSQTFCVCCDNLPGPLAVQNRKLFSAYQELIN